VAVIYKLDFKRIFENTVTTEDIIKQGAFQSLLHFMNVSLPPYTMAFRMPLSKFERFRSHSAEGRMYDIVAVSNAMDQAAGIVTRLSM